MTCRPHRLLFCLFLSAAAGCNDGTATVSGKITFNGESVSQGMITLEPVDGVGSVTGANVEAGTYTIENVLPGEKLVRISAAYVVGTEKRYPDEPTSTDVIELMEDLIPAEFNNASTLKLTVEAPDTPKDFELTGADPRTKKK